VLLGSLLYVASSKNFLSVESLSQLLFLFRQFYVCHHNFIYYAAAVCSALASLNLPAAIEDLSGAGGVPQSLLEKAATVRQSGGAAGLTQLINDLPALLQRNKEILDEAWLLF